MDRWAPKTGEMIEIGVPGVSLSLYEFIAVTSEDKFLVWNKKKTKALIFNREFCYPRRVYATV